MKSKKLKQFIKEEIINRQKPSIMEALEIDPEVEKEANLALKNWLKKESRNFQEWLKPAFEKLLSIKEWEAGNAYDPELDTHHYTIYKHIPQYTVSWYADALKKGDKLLGLGAKVGGMIYYSREGGFGISLHLSPTSSFNKHYK